MVTDCVPRARDDDIRASVAFATAVILVIAATATVRLWPLLTRQMLGGVLEYDDGVYYNAAAHLAGGALPYRDFVFLQPPGITLLLAPVVGLARLIGDPAAFVLARLGIVAVASVNVFLLMRLIRRWSGPVAAVAAGLTYAAWGGAAAAERTVLLEPLLGLGLLTALTLLGPGAGVGAGAVSARNAEPGLGRRNVPIWRVASAGVVLGLALTVKTWVVADVVVLAGWLLWRSGWRAALTIVAAPFVTAVLVCLPFFLAAPSAMVHQVVTDQLGRTETITGNTVLYLHQLAGMGEAYHARGVGEAAVIAVLAAGVGAVIVTLWRGPRLWAVLAIVQVALVVPQNSYTYHYMDFAAPALAGCVGVAVTAMLRGARRLGRPTAALVGVAAATALGLLAWQAATVFVIGWPMPAAISEFLRAHPCAFTDYPPVLPVAGVETAQVRRHCGNLVDYTGAALSVGNGHMLVSYGQGGEGRKYRSPPWQAQVRKLLGTSDAAVLSWRTQYWTPTTKQFFHRHFRVFKRPSHFKLWIVRPLRS